jgi:hypothetical protein
VIDPRVFGSTLILLSACAAKQPASEVGSLLDGTWWLADTEAGPLRARLQFKDQGLEVIGATPPGVTTAWSIWKDKSAWAAHGPEGATLVLDDRGADSLIIQSGDQIGLAWRAESLPASLAGTWRWRTPDGKDRGITLLGGPVGGPARAVLDAGTTGEVWALRREGSLSIVLQVTGAEAELWHLHPRGEAWLTWTGTGTRAGTLYRPGRPPTWIPVNP